MGLSPGEKNVIWCLKNNTVQYVSNMSPKPTKLLVKYCMMYPVVVIVASNCGIGGVAIADDRSTCLVAIPRLICGALLLGVPCGAVGAM